MAYTPIMNLRVQQGEPFRVTLTLSDDSGALLDLTGYTARMQIRTKVDSDAAIAEWSTTSSDLVLGGVAGTLAFSVATEHVNALSTTNTKEDFVYDLFLTSPDGTPSMALAGTITVFPRVTR